jgi:hypothetical protein
VTKAKGNNLTTGQTITIVLAVTLVVLLIAIVVMVRDLE